MIIRPGKTIREYIEWKRLQHFKPVSLMIVHATLYGLIYHYSGINLYFDAPKVSDPMESGKIPDKIVEMIKMAPSIIMKTKIVKKIQVLQKPGLF